MREPAFPNQGNVVGLIKAKCEWRGEDYAYKCAKASKAFDLLYNMCFANGQT